MRLSTANGVLNDPMTELHLRFRARQFDRHWALSSECTAGGVSYFICYQRWYYINRIKFCFLRGLVMAVATGMQQPC